MKANLVSVEPTKANLVKWLIIISAVVAAYFVGSFFWSHIAQTYFS